MSICLKDIYTGRPDACDEIAEDGIEKFTESFILPPSFDLQRFLEHGWCYVTGYKGTGKSALLWYVKHKVESDQKAVTDFISFKKDYTEIKRRQMSQQAKKISTDIIIPPFCSDTNDYESIWKWELFKKINEINGINHSALFVNDDNWKKFKKALQEINKDAQITKTIFNPSIKYENEGSLNSITASGFLPTKGENRDVFSKFELLINQAEDAFKHCIRTERPMYLFIDELEAYNGANDIFCRDLSLIRDLILVVKQINQILRRNKKNGLIVLAVRTEVQNAIYRVVTPKEINKALGGFEYKLKWNMNDSESIDHPIFQILLKRIQMSESNIGLTRSFPDIFSSWFPITKNEYYGSKTIVSYIVDNTWNKPRDIVNMLTEICNCALSNETRFTPAVFKMINKDYSKKCQEEIREEMISLYPAPEVDEIFAVFQNFKTIFTQDDLKSRIQKQHSSSKWAEDVTTLINNLYRLGIIGNYSRVSQANRWCYRDDEAPFLTDDWQLTIHRALWPYFSLIKKHKNAISLKSMQNEKYIGEIVTILVKHIDEGIAFVEFQLDGKRENGVIFKSEISSQYVTDITDYIWEGEETEATIKLFDASHGNWQLTLK